ncbi:MAG: hypothetical protein LBJ07_03285, partial [Actinomycetes bacterium]|nr:hypothetical protein [Actinomycetes bacterium]
MHTTIQRDVTPVTTSLLAVMTLALAIALLAMLSGCRATQPRSNNSWRSENNALLTTADADPADAQS